MKRAGTAHSHNLKVRHCVIVFVFGTEAVCSLPLSRWWCWWCLFGNGMEQWVENQNRTYERMMAGLLSRFRVRVLLFRSKMSALPTDCSLVFFAVCVYV